MVMRVLSVTRATRVTTDQADEDAQGDVSTFIFGMPESSGFPK